MSWRKRRDPTVDLERATVRLLGEISEAAAAVRAASRPVLAAAEHLHNAASERIKENEHSDRPPPHL